MTPSTFSLEVMLLTNPFPQQKRVVAKLDTSFTILGQFRMRLKKIRVLLKQFRQAVLMQAVMGKLTSIKWQLQKIVL